MNASWKPLPHRRVPESELEIMETYHYYDGPLAGLARYKGTLYTFEVSDYDYDLSKDVRTYTLRPLT